MAIRQATGRKMKFNHSNALPKIIISYDSETLPTQSDSSARRFTHRFRLGVAISARMEGTTATCINRHWFRDTATFWEWLKSMTGSNYTTWLIGHNILYDLVVTAMPTELLQSGFVVDLPRHIRTREDNNEDNAHAVGLCCIDSPPTILGLRCTKTNGRLVIVDSLNWFPAPLAELGEACKLQKMPMPAFSASDDEWFPYCQRDAEIVFHTFVKLIAWVRDNNFGLFRYTAPSQAMSAYRHRFMVKQIYIHDNKDVKAIERLSYFGGRTEVYKIGELAETVHQLDINALFPSIMQRCRFPFVLDRYEMSQSYREILPSLDWSASVAEVDLDTNEPIFPVRTDTYTIYPAGKFKTTLAGPELVHAWSKGYIRGVRSWAEYKTADIFSDWVGELWTMRQGYKATGETLYAEFTKRLMNSLYGKFGQRSPEWINDPGNLSGLPWSSWMEEGELPGEITAYRSFGWQIQKQTKREEIDGTFVAIASFVTSYARVRMNALRAIAERPNVFYQGVDSLIVTNPGRDKLQAAGEIDDTTIGKLRHQLTTDSGTILGCADYQLGDKIVIAGRAKNVAAMIDGEMLQRKFAAQRDLFRNHPIDSVEETLEPWRRAGVYRKGTVTKSGWIEPLTINQ